MKMYIVKYSTGSYDDYSQNNLFVTDDLSKATKYVEKSNNMLKKWKEHYRQYEEDFYGISWIKKEYKGRYFKRWYMLQGINECYFQEIEFRK